MAIWRKIGINKGKIPILKRQIMESGGVDDNSSFVRRKGRYRYPQNIGACSQPVWGDTVV